MTSYHENERHYESVLDDLPFDKNTAILKLENGGVVTHVYFDSDEYIRQEGDMYIGEDGSSCSISEFWERRSDTGWDEGWKIY